MSMVARNRCVVGIERSDLVGLGFGDQLGQQCTAEVVDFSGDCVPVARVHPLLPLRRSHQNNRASLTSTWLLEFEQELLALQPARITGQLAVAAHHPMAGDDDAERISADGLAHLLCRGGVAECGGQLPVRDSLAVRDGGQHFPDALLQVVSVHCGRKIEIGAVTGEIVGQLSTGLCEQRIGLRFDLRTERVLGRPIPVMWEVQTDQRLVVGDQGELAEGAVDGGMSGVHTL